MKRMKLGTVVAAAVLAIASLTHAANIVILNNDGALEGFNDATPAAPVGGNWGTTIGQQRLIAFTYAAEIWGACLQSNVTITVRAQMDPLTCDAGSAVLGLAGTTTVHRNFTGTLAFNTWFPQALANKLAGSDLDPSQPDINATFNSDLGNAGCLTGTFFYYGLDGNPGSNIDFATVVLHEICHGLGFQTYVDQAGAKLGGFNDHLMPFLEHHFAVPSAYLSMSNAQRAAGNIADPNLHCSSTRVTAAGNSLLSAGISDGHVRMHGPNPYQPGSSVSHWSTALAPNELMEPFYTGANHDPSLAWTLLDEVGWSLLDKVTDGCDGTTVNLAAPSGALANSTDDIQERGIFVTALKDYTLCSIGMEGDFVPGETITARVYAANGTTRGALLASGSATVEFAGLVTHYVPVSQTLEACKEYDITFEFEHTVTWPWWDESTTPRPYDASGVIRVRDGDLSGNAADNALPHFTLQGSTATAPAPQVVSVLSPIPLGGLQLNNATNRGAFIKAVKTISVCGIRMEANFGGPNVVRLTTNIYHANGLVRGPLLATGTTQLQIPPGGNGKQWRDIPVNAVLVEGRDYEIEVLYPVAFEIGAWQETSPPTLFTVDDAITGVNSTLNGNPTDDIFMAIAVAWNEGPALNPLDITAPWLGAPDGVSTNSLAFGKYVEALHDQELSGLGLYADLAPAGTLTARVYNAVGTVRGSLISTGTVTTGLAGMRWHDLPVSASLVSGQDYDIELDWSAATVNGYPYWTAIGAQQPYNAYGLLSIVVGETGGVPDASQECAQFRVYSCATGTLTATGPVVTPKFSLTQAFPNPFSGATTLGFELDQPAMVSVQVYDVAGRKVADVMKSRALPAGPGELSIDAGTLVSGVYFVKLSTPSKSVTRKITILR